MASLSTSLRVGSTGASSLIRSAASIANTVNTYNDTMARLQYENSAKTDGDLQNYLSYLSGRVNTLKSTGTITNMTKAADMTQTMTSAIHSNMSSNIQRENIQIMTGNASPTDKLNLLGNQFQTAISIGDMSLAQSLESQAYSLSQTIQVQAQTAATARQTLANASSSASATGKQEVAQQIDAKFKQLNADAGAGGMDKLNTTLKTWVNDNKTQLLALANGAGTDPTAKAAIEKAVNTSQPNYADIAVGVGNAMIVAHVAAYMAEAPVDQAAADKYLTAAQDIGNGTTKLTTLYGSMSLNDLQIAQQNPAMYIPHENANTGQLQFSYNDPGKPSGTSAINGYKYDAKGNVIANFTGQAAGTPLTSQLASQTQATLTKLGFSFSTKETSTNASNDNGITVQASNVPKWLQPVVGDQKNVQLKAYVTPRGNIQLATLDSAGKGNIYMIAQDANGNHAVYKSNGSFADGSPKFDKQVAAGDYGFMQNNNSLFSASGNNMSKAGQNSIYDYFLNGNTTGSFNNNDLRNLINQSQDKFNQIRQQRIAAQAAIANNQPIQLTMPTLKGIPMSTPAPRQAPSPVAQPIVQRTVNPQPQTANPQGNNVNPMNQQQPGGINLTPPPVNGLKL